MNEQKKNTIQSYLDGIVYLTKEIEEASKKISLYNKWIEEEVNSDNVVEVKTN